MGRKKGSKNKSKTVQTLRHLEPKTVTAFADNLENESVAAGDEPVKKKRGRKSLKDIGREELEKNRNSYEPYQLSKDNYRADLMTALVWHDRNSSEENLKIYSINFVRNTLGQPILADQMNKLPDYEFLSFGKLARLFDMGADLQGTDLDHLSNYVAKLKAKTEKVKVVEEKFKKPTIQDKMHQHSNELSGFLDAHLDITMGYKKKKGENLSELTNVKLYLEAQNTKKPIPPQVAKLMQVSYQKQLDEFNLVKSKKDKELTEAYSTTKKVNLEKGIKFLENAVSSCEDFAKEHKNNAVVKIRKRKPKPPAKVVAKMKFQLKDDKLNLRSIDPAKIVDSGEVWVYDTKKRNLSVYRAADGKALTVKGTTLLNFDEDTSESKKIRKPEKFFVGAMEWTKRPLSKAFNEIRGLSKKPKGRMNKESIIVKVF